MTGSDNAGAGKCPVMHGNTPKATTGGGTNSD